MGGFWWQLTGGPQQRLASNDRFAVGNVGNATLCTQFLRTVCTGGNASAPPPAGWKRFMNYGMPCNDPTMNMTTQNLTDYTAEFLLTRGPYAML